MCRSATTTERPVAPVDAAAMIYAAGIGLSAIETDEGLTHHLADALIRERIRLGRAPNDLAAVRQEMRRLWGEHERVGRRRECARYATPSQRT